LLLYCSLWSLEKSSSSSLNLFGDLSLFSNSLDYYPGVIGLFICFSYFLLNEEKFNSVIGVFGESLLNKSLLITSSLADFDGDIAFWIVIVSQFFSFWKTES
jgi:hypothetical protein